MTDTELIADQARKIAHLENSVVELNNMRQAICKMLVCIGGPLNDNIDGFTKDQLKIFHKIHNMVRS